MSGGAVTVVHALEAVECETEASVEVFRDVDAAVCVDSMDKVTSVRSRTMWPVLNAVSTFNVALADGEEAYLRVTTGSARRV